MNKKELPTEWDKVFMNTGAVLVFMGVISQLWLGW